MKVELNERTIEGRKLLNFLDATTKHNLSIYLTFMNYCKNGASVVDSALYTADDFNTSERTVYRIVKNTLMTYCKSLSKKIY